MQNMLIWKEMLFSRSKMVLLNRTFKMCTVRQYRGVFCTTGLTKRECLFSMTNGASTEGTEARPTFRVVPVEKAPPCQDWFPRFWGSQIGPR